MRSVKAVAAFLLFLILGFGASSSAENVVEVPIIAAFLSKDNSPINDRGVFEVMLVWWDQKTDPNQVELRWSNAIVNYRQVHLDAMADAFAYALERTPSVRHSGTVTAKGISYKPMSSDGPSAGAVMAVGFIAVLKGDRLQRGIALTGTIESGGRIGPVGRIPDKVRAAAREGYHTVLIPSGQLHDPKWNLSGLAIELNVAIKEVSTVDEAYELMTGQRI
jgi:hypothetical protein